MTSPSKSVLQIQDHQAFVFEKGQWTELPFFAPETWPEGPVLENSSTHTLTLEPFPKTLGFFDQQRWKRLKRRAAKPGVHCGRFGDDLWMAASFSAFEKPLHSFPLVQGLGLWTALPFEKKHPSLIVWVGKTGVVRHWGFGPGRANGFLHFSSPCPPLKCFRSWPSLNVVWENIAQEIRSTLDHLDTNFSYKETRVMIVCETPFLPSAFELLGAGCTSAYVFTELEAARLEEEWLASPSLAFPLTVKKTFFVRSKFLGFALVFFILVDLWLIKEIGQTHQRFSRAQIALEHWSEKHRGLKERLKQFDVPLSYVNGRLALHEQEQKNRAFVWTLLKELVLVLKKDYILNTFKLDETTVVLVLEGPNASADVQLDLHQRFVAVFGVAPNKMDVQKRPKGNVSHVYPAFWTVELLLPKVLS